MKRLLLCVAAVLFVASTSTFAQPGKLSDADLKKLATSHATAADHQKLAAHYTAHALEHENEAKLHDELAAQYEKTEPKLATEAKHYAGHSREAAEALRELAKIHGELAKEHAAKK